MLRQSEVSDMWLVVRIEQHVGRFEIAVENALGVRVVDRFRDAHHATRSAGGRQRSGAHHLRQRRPFDQCHREERLPIDHPCVVDRHNVGMSQAPRCCRLGVQTPLPLLTCERAAQQNLQRHDAVQASLPRAIHDAHSTTRQFLQQIVIAEAPDVAKLLRRLVFTRVLKINGPAQRARTAQAQPGASAKGPAT